MTNTLNTDNSPLPLGQSTVYKAQYDASLLYPIPRKNTRQALFADHSLPFIGIDTWTAFEVSWLNTKGKPQLSLVEFIFSYSTLNIIESKSFKLYLNSFNQTKFDSQSDVERVLRKDLRAAAEGEIEIIFYDLDDANNLAIDYLPGHCIDESDINVECYHRDEKLLSDMHLNDKKEETLYQHKSELDDVENETLYSHLLKTNCPVTNQPDWATIFIQYSGPKISHENLLAYLISFREHQDFHENCVEQIFFDIQKQCKPTSLAVYARYTRRGGLDINPLRYSLNNTQQPFKDLRLRTRRQ